jgi:hypothetical protein
MSLIPPDRDKSIAPIVIGILILNMALLALLIWGGAVIIKHVFS